MQKIEDNKNIIDMIGNIADTRKTVAPDSSQSGIPGARRSG